MFVLGLTHQQLFDWNDIFINASERSQIYYFTKLKNMVHYNFFIQVSDYILDLLVCWTDKLLLVVECHT